MPILKRFSRRHFLLASLGAGLSVSTGCGTILHPERRGQPSGRLDWGVVLLDGLGLLLFFIPGVVAFAVDFATGAIYLPPCPPPYAPPFAPPGYPPPQPMGQTMPKTPETRLVAYRVPRDEISKQRIEEVVSTHAGRPVQLVDGQYQTQAMEHVDDFWTTADRMAVNSP